MNFDLQEAANAYEENHKVKDYVMGDNKAMEKVTRKMAEKFDLQHEYFKKVECGDAKWHLSLFPHAFLHDFIQPSDSDQLQKLFLETLLFEEDCPRSEVDLYLRILFVYPAMMNGIRTGFSFKKTNGRVKKRVMDADLSDL